MLPFKIFFWGGSFAVHLSKQHFLSRCYARYFNCKKIWSTEIRTRGCWVRSVNATSVLCRPPDNPWLEIVEAWV